MYTGNYLLTVLAVISISGYCIQAWNQTTLPILVTKLLGKIGFLKKERTVELQSIYTRDDWQIWSTGLLPDWAVSWLNCSICQTPYVATLFSWVLLYKLGNFSINYSILGWCISLVFILKLQSITPPYASKSSAEKKSTPVYKVHKNYSLNKEPLPPEPELSASTAAELLADEMLASDQLPELKKAGVNLIAAKIAAAKIEADNKLKAVTHQYDIWQKEMGIVTEEGPNGEKVITGYNPIMLESLKFFKMEQPCTFDGCEELRKQYNKELEEKGAECPACAKSELQRKYMITVKRAIEAHKSRNS